MFRTVGAGDPWPLGPNAEMQAALWHVKGVWNANDVRLICIIINGELEGFNALDGNSQSDARDGFPIVQ